jgi:DNA repair protein RecO (recombination protein O)
MSEKSPAIVLNKRPYGDKSLIISLLTRKNGLITCFTKNAYAKSRRIDRLQPLTAVEVVYSLKENREMAFLQEIVILEARINVFSDVIRTSVAFYMAELLNRVIREHLQPDERVFSLIALYMEELEQPDGFDSDIHLRFTLSMIEAMGFKPVVETGEPVYFNLVEGVIGPDPFGKYYVSGTETALIAGLIETGKFATKPTKAQRTVIFNTLTAYLDHQLGYALNLKSPAVLQEILNT